MGLIKSLITLTLIVGAVFFYSSGPINTDNLGAVNLGASEQNKTVLEPRKATMLDQTLSGDIDTMAITTDSSKAFIVGEEDQRYSSDIKEEFKGLKPLKTSVFQEVYMIGQDGIKDLSNFSIKSFDGEKNVELTQFAGSSMSQITDVDKSQENLFIGYNKRIPDDSNAYTLIYDVESQELSKIVKLDDLERAGAVEAGKNSFYAMSKGKLSKYSMDGDRVWKVKIDYPDLTKGKPYPVLKREGDDIYVAMTVSRGHHEIIAAKISSDGKKQWIRKIDLKGLKDKVSTVEVSDKGFLIASTARHVESIEGLVMHPSDVVLKNLDLSDGSTKWTKVYNNPESSREEVLRLEETEKGFEALMKVNKMKDIKVRPIESGIEKMNSLMKISGSGNITEVINTRDYSSDRLFMLENIYSIKNNSIYRLQRSEKIVIEKKPDYLGETYEEKTSKQENEWYHRLRDTELKMEAFSSEGKLMLNITNTGRRELSATNFSVRYGPKDFSNPIRYRLLERYDYPGLLSEDSGNECLMDEDELSRGETLTCLTGFKYPENSSIEIEIIADNLEYRKSLMAN